MSPLNLKLSVLRAVMCALVACLLASSAAAQNSLPELREKAKELMRQSKMTEAVPVLERIIERDSEDADAYELLGSALLGLAINTDDPEEKKRMRLAARQSFIRARDLGQRDEFC